MLGEQRDAADAEKRQKERAKEGQRRAIYVEAQRQEAERVAGVLRRQADKEAELGEMQRARDTEAARRALERRLALKHKAESVEEAKRRDAFERAEALRRIEQDSARGEALMAQRTALQVRAGRAASGARSSGDGVGGSDALRSGACVRARSGGGDVSVDRGGWHATRSADHELGRLLSLPHPTTSWAGCCPSLPPPTTSWAGCCCPLPCLTPPNPNARSMQRQRRQANLQLSIQRQQVTQRMQRLLNGGGWEKAIARGISVASLLNNREA